MGQSPVSVGYSTPVGYPLLGGYFAEAGSRTSSTHQKVP